MHVCTIYLSDMFVALAADMKLDPYSVNYAVSRIKNEGVRFLTVTLPSLAKAVIASLEIGSFQRPTAFAWQGRSLRFMRSSLSLIFNSDGTVSDNPTEVANGLSKIRHVCEYFYKTAFSFQKEELKAAEQKYVDLEDELRDSVIDNGWGETLRKNLETYYGFDGIPTHVPFTKHRPRFTSGAFAGSSRFTEPFYITKWLDSDIIGDYPGTHEALKGCYKSYPSMRSKRLKKSDEPRHCEVLFVPKDSRGPRVISKEPLHALRGQMSYFDFMVAHLQRVTSGRIQFTDQLPFREIAREGSISKHWSTLDLKDASDSVLLRLVRRITRNIPVLSYALKTLRTPIARMPSGRRVQLSKLAGMGSGLTFPTMALVIHLSICSYVSIRHSVPFKDVYKSVYVYGDDVIVPRKWHSDAVEALNLSKLKVNAQKSFSDSHFRESCGGDYYYGVDVSPVRLKLQNAGLKEPSAYRKTGRITLTGVGLLELERHCRVLFEHGLYTLREYLYKRLERTLGPLPTIGAGSPALGRVDFDNYVDLYTEQCWVPVPETTYVEKMSTDRYLGKVLSKRRSRAARYDKFTELLLSASETDSSFGELAIPRRIRLIRRHLLHLEKITSPDIR